MWFSHGLLFDVLHTLYVLTFAEKNYSSDTSKKLGDRKQAKHLKEAFNKIIWFLFQA